MEINITIIIQAIIFMILFVVLSKMLFNPLDRLFTERLSQTSEQQKKIGKINKEIDKQKTYIIKKTNAKIQTIEKLYNFWKNDHYNTTRTLIKSMQVSVQKTYTETTIKLKDSKIAVEKDLEPKIDHFANDIYNKMYTM